MASDAVTREAGPEAGFRQRMSWCLFDFANSAFVTIMITAFYGRFFTDVIARETAAPATLWAAAIALAQVLVAISSPLLGAVADRSGRKRTLLRVYVLANVLSCAALGLVRPGTPMAVAAAFVLIVIADVAFEGAYVFYNAFLPELVPPERLGRLSGYGWALGYVGGLGCLVLIQVAGWVPERYDVEVPSTTYRLPVVVALWLLVFSLPMLLWVRDRPRSDAAGPGEAALSIVGYGRRAFGDVRQSWRYLRGNKDLFWFFLAYLLFTDGLETVITFTGKFTGDALGFSPGETVKLFVMLNVVAAPGALVFGWLVDRIGGVRGVTISVLLWVGVVVGSVLVQTKGQFWPVAFMAAVGLGATQSASRAVVARIVPRAQVGRVFGMMTVVGRASAVVGPLVYGIISDSTGSARLAVASIGLFFVASLVLLGRVDEGRAQRAAAAADATAS